MIKTKEMTDFILTIKFFRIKYFKFSFRKSWAFTALIADH